MENEKGIVKLKYPIPVEQGDGTVIDVDQLKMGRLKLKHLRVLPDDFSEKGGKLCIAELIPLIASVTNTSIASIDEIDMEDIGVLVQALMGFLAESPQTGEK